MSGAARGCVCRTCLVALLILFALSAQARDGSLPGNDEACGSTQDTACDSLCVSQKAGASPSGSLCIWREADVITADSRAQADSLLASTMEGDSIVPLLPSDSLPKGVVLADVVVTGGDSLEVADALNRKHLLANTRTYRMVCVGLPLVAGGLLAMKEDKNFRSLRTDYLPHYKHTADDYLQYSPAVVMVGLKAAGVRSRSSWGRMLVSDAFSVALMAAVTNGMKEGLHVLRPDGSNRRSFPSGHTATAFMTATMLTKEYGYKSKWVGFGSYAMASSVGLMRMANNRHWLSDVMIGAGVGVMATELGYFLADLIFKDKGIYRPRMEREVYGRWDKSSFLGLRLGGYIPLHRYNLGTGDRMEAAAGCAAGVEGAYFFNHWIGLGGQFQGSNYRVLLQDQPSRTARALAVMAGPYFSWPLTSRCSLGTKLVTGYVYMASMKLPEQTIAARNGADFGTGLSCSYKLRQNYMVALHLDYHLLPPQSTYSRREQHMLWAGSSFNIIF